MSVSLRSTSTSTVWQVCSGASPSGPRLKWAKCWPGPPSANRGPTPSTPTAPGHSSTRAATRRPSSVPFPGDTEDEVVSLAVVQICADVLAAYELEDDDAIDAIRAFRSTLHGFVALESGGGFGLNVDIDRSFERLVRGITLALASWTDQTAQQLVSDNAGES